MSYCTYGWVGGWVGGWVRTWSLQPWRMECRSIFFITSSRNKTISWVKRRSLQGLETKWAWESAASRERVRGEGRGPRGKTAPAPVEVGEWRRRGFE